MRRDEFIYELDSYWDLADFCENYGIETLYNVCDRDGYHEYIDENLVEWAREDSWKELLDRLHEYDDNDGYDFYEYDDYYGRYYPVEFSDLKQRVLDEADANGVWDEDGTEAAMAEEEPEEDDIELDCSIDDMIAESRNYVQSFTERELEIVGEGLRSVRTMVE